MASTAVLNTLQRVTELKLSKLARKQASFETNKKSTLEAVSKEPDAIKKVRILIERLEDRQHGTLKDDEFVNIKRFLDLAEHDTSIAISMINQWREKLERELDWQEEVLRFTSLFGRLVTEWIKNTNEVLGIGEHQPGDADSDSATSRSSFEPVGREEMHEQRKEWESYAFNESHTDPAAIEKYLDSFFLAAFQSKKSKLSPLEMLREGISTFDSDFERFDEKNVRASIDGLLKADLFSGEKRKALVDLRAQGKVLVEMSDCLNADFDALQVWQWDPAPVQVTMRKQINGKYRFYMDEELYQAIFIQWIGTSWAVHLKSNFVKFFRSGAWTQAPFHSLKRKDIRRREHFLGPEMTANKDSVRNERRMMYLEDYFMTQLPSELYEASRDYGDDDDGSSDTTNDGKKSPLAIKKSLLSLVTTEQLINIHIYDEFTIVQSDFKWFGPSIPHSTILTVLKYFRVTEKWMEFFTKFLCAPIVFAQDGVGAEARTRNCGIPMSHVLADAMGESVLFVLDFAVNQQTKGANLYRFHDDLWFWGQSETCVEAWKAMTQFSKVMGLELNEEKTGACHTTLESKIQPVPNGLPEGNIRWGFLKMDATSGRWCVDDEQIKEHTLELKRQLSVCRSVFAYVEAYNSYMGHFFLNNLGPPTACLGREHVDMVVATIEKIQKDLFCEDDTSPGSITDHLRQMIADRFDVKNIPDGFFFLPTEVGGLGVEIPLIPLVRAREVSGNPLELIQQCYDEEVERYESAKNNYETGETPRTARTVVSTDKNADDEPFMSLEEFMRFREERSRILLNDAYRPLLKKYSSNPMVPTKDILQASKDVNYGWTFRYKWWLLELYGREVLNRFGSLSMGEKELLPIGLLDMLRSEKVRWQG